MIGDSFCVGGRVEREESLVIQRWSHLARLAPMSPLDDDGDVGLEIEASPIPSINWW